jgi:hypothetical protein
MSNHGIPVPLLKFHIATILPYSDTPNILSVEEKEPIYVCLRKAKASQLAQNVGRGFFFRSTDPTYGATG